MIQTKDINVNPYLRDELFPSYKKNIGEEFPAILIEGTSNIISIYDGEFFFDEEAIELKNKTIEDVCQDLIDRGVSVKVFPGMETVTALALTNYSNVDISEKTIISSPMEVSDMVSELIAPNIPGLYKDMVDIEIMEAPGIFITKTGKLLSDSSMMSKHVYAKHFARTFILKVSESNIIRRIEKFYDVPNIKAAVIGYNLKTFGADNAHISL